MAQSQTAVPNGPRAEAVSQTPARQFLTFMLGGEMFAMDILGIKEIIEYSTLTEVPMMPASVRGVINLRGSVVPVIDLAVRFGRAPAPVTKRTCVVIVEIVLNDARQDVGVVVDAVNEVLDILPEQIEPPPTFGTRIRTDFIHGMGKVNNRFVILLDANQVLSLDELAEIAEAAQAPAA